jgi:hypothetical protein
MKRLNDVPKWMTKAAGADSIFGDAERGTLQQCPHCNGYGSSFKDPEDVNKCSFCGGSGVVSPVMLEKYKELFGNQIGSGKRSGLKRFYLERSSLFDAPENIYNSGLFARAILENGGRNVGVDKKNGWSNQPEVVTFDALEESLKGIIDGLNQLPPFKGRGCIIHEQDWTQGLAKDE